MVSYIIIIYFTTYNEDYKRIEKSTTELHNVYFDKAAHCYVSEQTYKVDNIPYEKGYGVTEEFYNVFKKLPAQFTTDYYRFLDDWGTVSIIKLNSTSSVHIYYIAHNY